MNFRSWWRHTWRCTNFLHTRKKIQLGIHECWPISIYLHAYKLNPNLELADTNTKDCMHAVLVSPIPIPAGVPMFHIPARTCTYNLCAFLDYFRESWNGKASPSNWLLQWFLFRYQMFSIDLCVQAAPVQLYYCYTEMLLNHNKHRKPIRAVDAVFGCVRH